MSAKGRMMHMMMRYRHLLKGQLKREVIDKSTSIEELRRQCDDSAARLIKIPDGISVVEAGYKPLYAEWIVSSDAEANRQSLTRSLVS